MVIQTDSKKHGYWTRVGRLLESAGAWLESARRNGGNGRPDWQRWVKNHAGAQPG